MYDCARTLNDLLRLGTNIAQVFTRRVLAAEKNYISSALNTGKTLNTSRDGYLGNLPFEWGSYVLDWTQRCVLFADTMRRRGNNYLAHERAGKPPLLAYEYETIVDGRQFKRPVNYALVASFRRRV